MNFYVDKFPKNCGVCPLHRGIEKDGHLLHCGILPANKSIVSADFRPTFCPLKSRNEQIKIKMPEHLAQHVLTVKALFEAGLPIEAAVHQVTTIYELDTSNKTLLYLSWYYEQRDQINGLIEDYVSEFFGSSEVAANESD